MIYAYILAHEFFFISYLWVFEINYCKFADLHLKAEKRLIQK